MEKNTQNTGSKELNTQFFLSRLQSDYNLLKVRVELVSEPMRYTPLGGFLYERIVYLQGLEDVNELLNNYILLFRFWEKQYEQITGSPNNFLILKSCEL